MTVSLQREEPIAVEVKPALVAKTRKELEATDLAGLQASERESPVPDSFRFDLTYGELRINGGDVALGELEALQPALDALNELLAAAIEARGEGLRAPTDQS